MSLALTLLPILLQFGPDALAKVIALWKRQEPEKAVALAEWEALIATLGKPYDHYIDEAKKASKP